MCGIAGYLPGPGAPLDRAVLERMCNRLAHRGPDAAGFYLGGAALGHRRLSIIDVGGGQQPLGNEDGSVQVVFNGEIYNFLELRGELLKKGHRFSTRSDTEVLVHLYEEAGERLPEYLNGMFAFAIWDGRKQELFLARDRLGKKPLYYSASVPGVKFCFASELKAFAALPGFEPRMDVRSLADFLALSYIPDPQTIYRGVYKLEPAHCMTVTPSGCRKRRYWTPQFAAPVEGDVDRSVEEIRALARDAVTARLMSDVPLGAFLSGGVDSSAVVGIMAEAASERVKAFSIGFSDKRFDELAYARLAAARYGTEHHTETVTPSVHDVFPTLVEHFDEPFGDASAIPTLYLARMTRRHVTVALSGDGADELFGGYRRYFYGALEERIRERLPRWFRQTAVKAGAKWYPKFDYLPQVFRAKTLLGNLAQEIGDAYFTSMSTFRDEGLNAVLSPEMQRELGGYSPRENFRARFQAVSELSPLEQMQAVDLDTYLPGDILVKADRATMAHSLESRSPWLDYRLAELAFRLPPSFKVHGKIGKYVFKRAVEPYVPQPLLTRRKMGFSVPLASWFRSSLKPVFEAAVLGSAMEPVFSPGAVRQLWSEHQNGSHNHDRKLWNLLMFASWCARFYARPPVVFAPEATTLSGIAELG